MATAAIYPPVVAAAQHGQEEQARLADMVDVLCASGRSAEAHHRVSLFLSSTSHDGRAANFLLRCLLRARTPLLTLRLLQATPPDLVIPSLPNYNRLLRLLCSHSSRLPLLLLAHRLLLRMRVPPDVASYAALLDGYSCLPDPRAAQQLLDEMPHHGIVPNSLARTFLVKAFLRSRDVDGAIDLISNHLWPSMEQCREEDQAVKNAAFANLVHCLCAQGFFHIVFRIAEEMPQRGSGVDDEFAYAQMIDSLCRTGQHHGASRIVYMMVKRGLRPSTASYNCIVHGLCTSQKSGGRLRAYQLVMEGKYIGYRLSEVTYKVLIDALCRENELAKAKDILELMLQAQCGQDKGFAADDETRTRMYNMFLGALRIVDNPSKQLDVLLSMLQSECRPDVITMNTVIHGFCKVGRVQEARRIVDDMLNGKFCAPDVVTFTTLIRGYLDIGEHAEALHWLHTLMPTHRCSPNVITYNSALNGLFSLGQVDSAMQVFNEMKSNRITADCATHTLVIKGLCEAGQLEKAKTFWDDVVWPSGIHDDYVYAAILGGLCKLGKLEQACDFFYELVDCGVAPSIVCYNILIDTACKQGLKKQAYQLVKEMRRNGLAPDAVTWRILDKLHRCNREEIEEELHVLHVDPSAADDKVEPLIPTWNEISSLSSPSSSNDAHEAIDEYNNDTTIEEVGHSQEVTVDPPGCTEPAKEEDYQLDNKTGEITMGEGEGTKDDAHGKQPKQSMEREPLSRVARKVFGLM